MASRLLHALDEFNLLYHKFITNVVTFAPDNINTANFTVAFVTAEAIGNL